MSESEILERIDGHMARGNEIFERFLVVHDDTRRFVREQSRRNELVMQQLAEQIGAQREEVLAQTQVLRDLHEETLAQRQSIWRVHDKLEDFRPPERDS